MISLVKVKEGYWEVCENGQIIAKIYTKDNSFHMKNCYVEWWQEQNTDMTEAFSMLRRQTGRPLQVMMKSSDPRVRTLLESGFECRRRCWVNTFDVSELAEQPVPWEDELDFCFEESEEYAECRRLTYNYYAALHEPINPITATEEEFSDWLPEVAAFKRENGRIVHYAMLDGDEVAYIGTENPDTFRKFALQLVSRQLRIFGMTTFECDDCDQSAMVLRSLFDKQEDSFHGTYIMK